MGLRRGRWEGTCPFLSTTYLLGPTKGVHYKADFLSRFFGIGCKAHVGGYFLPRHKCSSDTESIFIDLLSLCFRALMPVSSFLCPKLYHLIIHTTWSKIKSSAFPSKKKKKKGYENDALYQKSSCMFDEASLRERWF